MSRKTKRKVKATTALPPGLESINLNAAAIDIGSTEHYVAVPPDRSEKAVRSFGSYTAALHEMAQDFDVPRVTQMLRGAVQLYLGVDIAEEGRL